jgi:alcohol dehydrogenase (cytochrome c)
MTTKTPLLPALLSCAALALIASGASAQSVKGDPTLQTDPGNWPTYSGDNSGQRHSPLTQLDKASVTHLQAKWVHNVYLQRDLQANPVVMNGVMYISTYNRIDALDARTGRMIWQYQRQPLASAPQRGTAFYKNKVFVSTQDKHLIALDARTGAVIWDVPTGNDYQLAGQAPIIANGKVIVSGNRGGDGGFVQGYDAETGKYLWTWSPLPKDGDPALKTWGGTKPTGAPMWLSGSYDPALNLIYYGTGQPEPQWANEGRLGDNLYSDSVVAIDPDTGQMKWHFQFTPHDNHDWDAGQQSVLVDAPWKGKPRKLMLWANRNGFYYILDRSTGEFLQATKFITDVNWLLSMDKNGRPTANPAADPSVVGSELCPSTAGATNWPSPSYDAKRKTFFLVVQEGCSINFRDSSGSNAAGGYLESPKHPWQLYTRAIDAFTGEKKWDYKQTASMRYGPGLLSTEGGLVFTGEKQGQFSALDADTGQPLWNFYTGGVITTSPISYEVDGQQFIGLVSGSNVFAFALPDNQAGAAKPRVAAKTGGQ